MVQVHNLGFPRIGATRELKFALEKYWRKDISQADIEQVAQTVRQTNWAYQAHLDLVPVGDFSFYDQALDASFLVGNVPWRVTKLGGEPFDQYFRVARGRCSNDTESQIVAAGEMTKWFDTNYHYIVPEFTSRTRFSLQPERLLKQIEEAQAQNVKAKLVIIGPVTYLWLGKSKDDTNRLDLLPSLTAVYKELLDKLAQAGLDWVQIDEPILVTEVEPEWKQVFQTTYATLAQSSVDILLASYFGSLQDNLAWAFDLPVAGWHIDAVRGRGDVDNAVKALPNDKMLSLGVIDGRNIWKTDLTAVLDWLEPIAEKLGERLWIAPSCSLLHVPIDLGREKKLDPEVASWLAFAVQKLEELRILKQAVNEGRTSVAQALSDNAAVIESRRRSKRIHKDAVQQAIKAQSANLSHRQSSYPARQKKQLEHIKLPAYPTTTIGSFPQTDDIRKARRDFRQGAIDEATYNDLMRKEISDVVRQQEEVGLDVLVHGEPERNDMVEYFGEQLEGFVFSQFGWVQSYGSRCIKPPILFGDVTRPRPMTVEWAEYAQSLTQKPMKGMLTGPVTILNWSFVRDDQPRRETCYQIALAMREEVRDLEKASINIIQIDEPALREGLPLRKSEWRDYLDWAVESFRITASVAADETQIHTHMCYSEFNDIIEDIAKMDADVITIETSRSDMELLEVFKTFNYPNEIGPGVYDIHSPNIPEEEYMVQLMQKATDLIPSERLWVNPDCGLKTRNWNEVIQSLKNMVSAAQTLRQQAPPARP